MESEEQLERFRRQWKRDLSMKNKSDSKSTNTTKNCKTEVMPDICPQKLLNQPKHSYVQCSSDPSFPYSVFKCVGQLSGNENLSSIKSEENSKRILSDDSFGKGLDLRPRSKRLKVKLKDVFDSERNVGELPSERLLDKLISDIDEITEIPFFDITLPREVAVKIFQFLSMRDLCMCAQVSRSWCSLSEDELLWCQICHRLGQEKIYTTCDKINWKQIVRHNVERQRSLVTNWKGRIGKLTTLEHIKGKALCAVHSYEDSVVAGYTSGDVKLWKLSTGDSCIFQPSSRSLLVGDYSLQENIVYSLALSADVTVASYTQGNIDIWSLESGTHPIQTFTPPVIAVQPVVYLSKELPMFTLSYGPYIDLMCREEREEQFILKCHLDNETSVNHTKLLTIADGNTVVIFSKIYSVHLYQPVKNGNSGDGHMTEIHNLIGSHVHTMDFKTDQLVLGVAHGSYFGLLNDQLDGFGVKLYDIKSGKLLNTLLGHTSGVSCMNLAESPVNELVTGSVDRRLRIYDMRLQQPVQTFLQGFLVSCVQMDDWKLVSGADNGFLCVWDRRMTTKLWEWHNRHPVKYSHFNDKTLIVANIPTDQSQGSYMFDATTHRRYRGSLNVYDFLADLTTKDVPEICLSTYDQPDASKYNISLAVPYDSLSF